MAGSGNCRRCSTKGGKMLTLKNLSFFEDAHAFIEYVHTSSKMLKNMYKGTFMSTFGACQLWQHNLGRVLINRDCSAIAGCRERRAWRADVQAIFCRRRHQPRRPPPAKIRPGRPAPQKQSALATASGASTLNSSIKGSDEELTTAPHQGEKTAASRYKTRQSRTHNRPRHGRNFRQQYIPGGHALNRDAKASLTRGGIPTAQIRSPH
jgi:hypothetical protein